MAGSTCQSCGAAIVWAETPEGNRQPFDREPTAEGNRLVLGRGPDTAPLAIATTMLQIAHDGPPKPARQRALAWARGERVAYVPHHATCPDREQWRGRTRKGRHGERETVGVGSR